MGRREKMGDQAQNSWLDEANQIKETLNDSEILSLYKAVNEEVAKGLTDISAGSILIKTLAREKIEDERKSQELQAKILAEELKIAAVQEKVAALRIKVQEAELRLIKAKASNNAEEISAAQKALKLEQERLQKQNKRLKTQTKSSRKNQKKLKEDYETEKAGKTFHEEAKARAEAAKEASVSWNPFTNIKNKYTQLAGGYEGANGAVKALDSVVKGIANLAKELDNTIEQVGTYQKPWDTRLRGLKDVDFNSISEGIVSSVGASVYIKQEELMKNIDTAVDKGIAFDLEQRAFLQTVSDGIASTFDAFDATLLKIVRIQQADSTSARLGMEAALNKFLNSSFSTTEYLSDVSDTVTTSLYEATSLLTSEESIAMEYQVQKWLGSLYSVGMSQEAIQGLASAIGSLASGDVSAIDTGLGKLIAMSAGRMGFNYSGMLTNGLDGNEMNQLMYSVVDYLAQIATQTEGNNVVQKQLASVYGLNVSDFRAISNLKDNIAALLLEGSEFGYSSATAELYELSSTYGKRMNAGAMMSNAIDNFKYSLSQGIANSPALYGIWTMSNMLDLVGGIPIPAIGAFGMGNGVNIDLETTVADIMKVGALSGSLLSSMGQMLGAFGSSLGNPGITGMLKAYGIDKSGSAKKVTRGLQANSELLTLLNISSQKSESSYQGNADGSDISNSVFASSEDEKSEIKAEQDTSENEDIKLKDVDSTLQLLLTFFNDVAAGSKPLYVKLDGNYFPGTN